mgnify:CR=1 FL=1
MNKISHEVYKPTFPYMKFTNLHSHTTFSISDGLNYPKDHFDFVIKNSGDEKPSMALTDHGNANGFGYAFQAQEQLKKKGIDFKFITGVEFYYYPDLELWKKAKADKAAGVEVEEILEEGVIIEIEEESRKKWYDPIKRRHHLVVVAYNSVGLVNLYRLVSRSYRNGFYRYPRIDNRMLEECQEGLIISSACLSGLPTWLALRDQTADFNKVFDAELKPLLDIFGKDRAFLEIQFNKLDEQKIVNDALIAYSKHSGFKLLATADSHYARPELWQDRELYRLLGWQTKGMSASPDDLPASVNDLKSELYPKNGEQMFAEYTKMYSADPNSEISKLVKEAIERSYDIGQDLCEPLTPDRRMKLPKGPPGISSQTRLEDLCLKGLIEKDLAEKDEYIERLEIEFNVIRKKNFADYFITLYEATTEIKKYQLSSPGRGSGCGSLTLYLLNITQLDPIKNGLLFERFLSEHRDEPPDVDLDSDDRDKSLTILKGLFGDTRVTPITIFSTLQLKSLIKSISKLYDIPFQDVNDVTMAIDSEAAQFVLDDAGGDQKLVEMNFENVMKHSKTFRKFIATYPVVGKHVGVLYNQIKSIGRHAGGVAITDCSEEAMPVIQVRGEDQTPWTEGITAKHLEPAGIIKYDFLAIQTLTFIRKCIELALAKQLGRKPSFDEVNEFYTENLHPDPVGDGDLKVFENVYQAGKFPGIFQFTQDGMQNLCVQSKPKSVLDLAAITSIYRPGPLKANADKKYIQAVHNPEDIIYDHPILEEVLGDTNGVLCYQEQFMILAHKLAGFSLEEADILRKLLVKPATSLSEEMKTKRVDAGTRFIQGCVDHALDIHRATQLWEDEILGFISYGFNKSHALAYAYVSYQCAWLFYKFPDEWACAYLGSVKDKDRDKAIADVEYIGYSVGKLDILKSSESWTVHNKELIPSLQTLKGFGDAAVEELLDLRKGWARPETEDVGKDFFVSIFESFFYDIVEVQMKKSVKIKKKWKFSKFNKRSLDALIKLEALDSLGIVGEGRLFENYAHMYRSLIDNWSKKEQAKFNIVECSENVSKKDWEPVDKIDFQVEILGTYDKELMFSSAEIAEIEGVGVVPLEMVNENPQTVWFILDKFEIRQTKAKKKDYYKLYISDITGHKRIFNYFLPMLEGFKKRGIYAADLYENGAWLNLVQNSYLVRLK